MPIRTQGRTTIEVDDDAHATTVEVLDSSIARSIARRFREVTGNAFHGPAEIREAWFDDDYLVLSVRLPFWLEEPTPESQYSQADREAICWGYLSHIFKSGRLGKAASNLFFKELVHFLVATRTPKRLAKGVANRLMRISERRLAGRPRIRIDGKLARRIRMEGHRVYDALLDLQVRIRALTKRRTRVDEAEVLRWLFRKYPPKKYPWLAPLPELTLVLPKSRYLRGRIEGFEPTSDINGNLARPALADPDTWSTLGLAAGVIQAALFKETCVRYPIQEIKKLIAPRFSKTPTK